MRNLLESIGRGSWIRFPRKRRDNYHLALCINLQLISLGNGYISSDDPFPNIRFFIAHGLGMRKRSADTVLHK